MPVPSMMTVDFSYYDKSKGGNTREQTLYSGSSARGMTELFCSSTADYHCVPGCDILRMVGGVQDDAQL